MEWLPSRRGLITQKEANHEGSQMRDIIVAAAFLMSSFVLFNTPLNWLPSLIIGIYTIATWNNS
jgi:hypothetical protein